jgi:hypothetical protein
VDGLELQFSCYGPSTNIVWIDRKDIDPESMGSGYYLYVESECRRKEKQLQAI